MNSALSSNSSHTFSSLHCILSIAPLIVLIVRTTTKKSNKNSFIRDLIDFELGDVWILNLEGAIIHHRIDSTVGTYRYLVP